jgi:hypothetical protein
MVDPPLVVSEADRRSSMKGKSMQTSFNYRTSWEDEEKAQPHEQPVGAGGEEPIYPDEDLTKGGKQRPQEDNGSGEDARPQEPLEDENVSWPTELGSNGEGDEDDTAWPTEKDGGEGEPEE